MQKRRKRQLLIVAGLIILAGAIFLTTRFSVWNKQQSEQEQTADELPVVSVFTVHPGETTTFIPITGRVKPASRILVFSEVGGVLQSALKPFKTGVSFQKGELMARVDNREVSQNLRAQKSSFMSMLSNLVAAISIDYPKHYETWQNYLSEFSPNEKLPPLPEVSDRQFQLYLNSNNIYSQYHSIRQMEIRLAKYGIYAAFDGTLTLANAEDGTVVSPGQSLGEFMSNKHFEVEASIQPDDLHYARPGAEVTLSVVGKNDSFRGNIIRINEKIDPQTQTVKIFIQLKENKLLKPGNFMKGKLKAATFQQSVKMSNDYLVQNNHVFRVKDSVAVLHPVTIESRSADSVVVSGLEEGMFIIDEEKSPAFEGTRVNFSNR